MFAKLTVKMVKLNKKLNNLIKDSLEFRHLMSVFLCDNLKLFQFFLLKSQLFFSGLYSFYTVCLRMDSNEASQCVPTYNKYL